MTTSNNYGIGSTHNFRKEIEDTLRPAMERQTRADMQSEPSHEVVNKEISYRWELEASAMGKLSNEELKVVYKNGWKPSECVESRDG